MKIDRAEWACAALIGVLVPMGGTCHAQTMTTPLQVSVPAQTGTIPPQTVTTQAVTVTLPAQAVLVPSATVPMPKQTVTIPAQTIALPGGGSITIPAQTLAVTTPWISIPAKPVLLAPQTVQVPAQQIQVPGGTLTFPGGVLPVLLPLGTYTNLGLTPPNCPAAFDTTSATSPPCPPIALGSAGYSIMLSNFQVVPGIAGAGDQLTFNVNINGTTLGCMYGYDAPGLANAALSCTVTVPAPPTTAPVTANGAASH
jgi:hypothetical protein